MRDRIRYKTSAHEGVVVHSEWAATQEMMRDSIARRAKKDQHKKTDILGNRDNSGTYKKLVIAQQFKLTKNVLVFFCE